MVVWLNGNNYGIEKGLLNLTIPPYSFLCFFPFEDGLDWIGWEGGIGALVKERRGVDVN